MNWAETLKSKFIIGLAPMDGYTDASMRQLQVETCRPDIIFTEFVSAEGLSKGGVNLYDVLLFQANEHPIIGQLFGKDPQSFYKSAIILCHLGFDGIDINMGCPAKTVTQHGSGAALIEKPELASEIIQAVKEGVSDWYSHRVTIEDLDLNQKTHKAIQSNLAYTGNADVKKPTVSVKTRIGISQSTIESWAVNLLKHNLDFVTIHGRTLKQGYSGQASWDEIKKVVTLAKGTSTRVWGNGDITSMVQARDYQHKYGVDGVLIGRAAFGNPWVFSEYSPTLDDKFHAMVRHAHIFTEVYPDRQFDVMRKHFLLYASGHPHAKQLRSKLVHLKSLAELYALESEFLS